VKVCDKDCENNCVSEVENILDRFWRIHELALKVKGSTKRSAAGNRSEAARYRLTL
jgi:hypothetical protein